MTAQQNNSSALKTVMETGADGENLDDYWKRWIDYWKEWIIGAEQYFVDILTQQEGM